MARPGLRNHPKFRRLVFTLRVPSPHAIGYLECLWHVAYETCNPILGDAVDVELAAEWPGEAGDLCRALTETGFLDDTPNGYEIHDFFDHAPEYVRKRIEREAQRREKGGERKRAFAPRTRKCTGQWRKAEDAGAGQEISTANSEISTPNSETNSTNCETNSTNSEIKPAISETLVEAVSGYRPDNKDIGGLWQTKSDIGGISRTVADLGGPPTPTPIRGSIPLNPSSLEPQGGKQRRHRRRIDYSAEFEAFWAAYPRGEEKFKAFEEWRRLQPDEELRAAMLAALERQKRSPDWLKEHGKYVPHAVRWLSRRRWEDETRTAAPSGQRELDATAERLAKLREKQLQSRMNHDNL